MSCCCLVNLIEPRNFHIYNNASYCEIDVFNLKLEFFHTGSVSMAAFTFIPLFINVVFVLKIYNYIKKNSMKAPVENQNKTIASNSINNNSSNSSITKRNFNAFKTLMPLILIYVLSVCPVVFLCTLMVTTSFM